MLLSFILLFLRLSPLFLVRLSRGWTATGNRQKKTRRKNLWVNFQVLFLPLPDGKSFLNQWENAFQTFTQHLNAQIPLKLCLQNHCVTLMKGEIGGCSYKHDFGFDSHMLLCQTGPFRRKSCWDDLFLTEEVWGGQMTAWVRLSFCWHACVLSAFIFCLQGKVKL